VPVVMAEGHYSFVVSPEKIKFFKENGYVVIEDLVSATELQWYRTLYDKLLRNEIDCSSKRSDLGGFIAPKRNGVENVTQIMWPSDFVPELLTSPYFVRARDIAKQILECPDAERDFDMMISKAPFTDTEVPWHQDMAYWIDLPDKRACSSWLALDDTTLDNGCMWFVPGSHLKPLRKHWPAGRGTHQGKGALMCDCSEAEGVPVPLKAGSATFHAGGTLHYSRGNKTNKERRGLIVNFRSQRMIEYERQRGMEHGRFDNRRLVRSEAAGGTVPLENQPRTV
jgi:phytanoyl-CoA hydroxylase